MQFHPLAQLLWRGSSSGSRALSVLVPRILDISGQKKGRSGVQVPPPATLNKGEVRTLENQKNSWICLGNKDTPKGSGEGYLNLNAFHEIDIIVNNDGTSKVVGILFPWIASLRTEVAIEVFDNENDANQWLEEKIYHE